MNNHLINLGLTEKNGKIVVSSRDVARVFEKRHSDVMRDIRAIVAVRDDFNQRNFALVEYRDSKGEKRPEYLLTRDGFTILVMGYTGEKAMTFKKAYIEAFNDMERKLQTSVLPSNYKESLIALIAKIEEAERLENQVCGLIEEKDMLETALNESLRFYTVAKYNNVFNMGWGLKRCQEIGKQLSAYCRARAIEIRTCQTNDERFGKVNSYPLTAWEAFLEVVR